MIAAKALIPGSLQLKTYLCVDPILRNLFPLNDRTVIFNVYRSNIADCRCGFCHRLLRRVLPTYFRTGENFNDFDKWHFDVYLVENDFIAERSSCFSQNNDTR
jgi:hypothetical protein